MAQWVCCTLYAQARWLCALLREDEATVAAAFRLIPESVVKDMASWLSFCIRMGRAGALSAISWAGIRRGEGILHHLLSSHLSQEPAEVLRGNICNYTAHWFMSMFQAQI